MAASDRTAEAVQAPTPKLSDFQQLILHCLAEESRYGLGLKRALQDYYGTEVNHGRLYPNLDDLAEIGFVEKGKIDRRTNSYEITDEGQEWLDTRREWEDARWDGEQQ